MTMYKIASKISKIIEKHHKLYFCMKIQPIHYNCYFRDWFGSVQFSKNQAQLITKWGQRGQSSKSNAHDDHPADVATHHNTA